MSIQLKSSAFRSGERIPPIHTCDGQDLSPELSWEGVPDGAESLVLIVDDPDAPGGTWVHWVLYEMPPGRSVLPQGIPADSTSLEDGTRQGSNDFRLTGYGGPCPPPGKAHRYFFRLYAIRKHLDLPPGATRAQVEKAMTGWVLDQGELMGTYARPSGR